MNTDSTPTPNKELLSVVEEAGRRMNGYTNLQRKELECDGLRRILAGANDTITDLRQQLAAANDRAERAEKEIEEHGHIFGRIGLLAHELKGIPDNAPTDECIDAIELSARVSKLRPLQSPANEDTELYPCKWAAKGVHVMDRGREAFVERVANIEGPDRFAIRRLGDCLNKNGEWEWEPNPSTRDAAFFARCRWATKEEAFAAFREAIRAARKGEG
jgi:hypothetical protein